MFNVAIFGGSKIDGGDLDPGERVISLALFGTAELDFASSPLAPGVDVTLIAIFGAASLKVRPQQQVRLSGFDLFGARHVEPLQLPPSAAATAARSDDEDVDEPLEVTAFSLFGGVKVVRKNDAPR